MSNALQLGIDVGITGAWAILDGDGALVAVEDLPVIKDGKLGWIDADALTSRLIEIRAGRAMRAMVERVHAMPANGCVASFSQGATLGSTLAALQILRVPIELCAPMTWKKALGLSKDKLSSLNKARLMFPTASLDRIKDHNRSEALLISWFAQNRKAA